jgi:hypothetical protein
VRYTVLVRGLSFCIAIWILSTAVAAEIPATHREPLAHAHAHNDYKHNRPLLDALEHGFCNVEADIFLIKGELLVAHEAEETTPGRTLESLYLAPLKAIASTNRGRIFRGGPSITLLIDIKTEAEATYKTLRPLLQKYSEVLTYFTAERVETNAVTVVLSGNRPRRTLLEERERLAAFDGRLADLEQKLPRSFMPLVSDNWRAHFTWNGEGSLSESEGRKLSELVARVHAEGRKFRLWAIPDKEIAWKLLRDAGVDLINTDDLSGLSSFLRKPQ